MEERRKQRKKKEKSVAFLHVSPLWPSETRVGYCKIIRIIKSEWNRPNIELLSRKIENSQNVWNFAKSHNLPKNALARLRGQNRRLLFSINAKLFPPFYHEYFKVKSDNIKKDGIFKKVYI